MHNDGFARLTRVLESVTLSFIDFLRRQNRCLFSTGSHIHAQQAHIFCCVAMGKTSALCIISFFFTGFLREWLIIVMADARCSYVKVYHVILCTRGVPLEARRRRGGRRESNHAFLSYMDLRLFVFSMFS